MRTKYENGQIAVDDKNNLKEAIEKVFELVQSDEFNNKLVVIKRVDSIRDFIDAFDEIAWIAKKIAEAVNVVYDQYHLCSEDEIIDVAAEILDALVKLPAVLEPFDAMLFKIIIKTIWIAVDK